MAVHITPPGRTWDHEASKWCWCNPTLESSGARKVYLHGYPTIAHGEPTWEDNDEGNVHPNGETEQ